MKQPEDCKTIELSLEQQKRGRGRPAKDDALTPAQRAKRYRDAKRALTPTVKNKSDVTNINAIATGQARTIKTLETQLELAETERHAAMERIAELERDLHNATIVSNVNQHWGDEYADKCTLLQEKFDLERQARLDAEAELASAIAATETAITQATSMVAIVVKLEKRLKTSDAKNKALTNAVRALKTAPNLNMGASQK